LEEFFRIYSYLNHRHNSHMAFDPTYPEIDMSRFNTCNWKSQYGDAREAIPEDVPKPRGRDVDLKMYVDADHAGDQLTRRS